MMAFLNSTNEANIAVYTPDEQMKRADILRQIREIEGTLQHHNGGWEERMAKWEAKASANQPTWTVITPEIDTITDGGQRYSLQKDGSFLASGYAPTKFSPKFTTKTNIRNITAFRLELLTDPNLPLNGPGRSIKGTCALTEFEVEADGAKGEVCQGDGRLQPTREGPGADLLRQNDRHRVTGPIDFAIDGNDETAWGIDAGPAAAISRAMLFS